MPALEIAGIVLGALPLAVKAVQGYREALYSLKRVKHDLDWMEHNISTEEGRLKNACEALLDGVVPRGRIRPMMENPFGTEWKCYEDNLVYNILISSRRLRLHTSYDTFEESITRMSSATEKLRMQLGFDQGSQINSRDRSSIVEAFKRNVSFTLKRKEYENILKELKASNNTLEQLYRADRELEPSRARRSRSSVTGLLRRLSQSIYSAVCGAITCSCISSHSIGLQLAHRKVSIFSDEVEEKVARELNFCVTLKISSGNTASLDLHRCNEVQLIEHWKNFELRLMGENKPHSNLDPGLSSPPLPSPRPRVRFQLPSGSELPDSASSIAPSHSPVTTTNGTETLPSKVLNLCEVAGRGPKAEAMKCYGYILDTKHKFTLSPFPDDPVTYKHVTLRQAIKGDVSDLPPFTHEERLRVALALSVGVLHLHGTTWLGQIVTLDNVVFLVNIENAMNQPAHALYQPFLIQGAPNAHAQQASATSTSPTTRTFGSGRAIDTALLALAAVLIQIIIGRIDDGLSMTGVMDLISVISRRKRGDELQAQTLLDGGINYAAAVTWCLESMFKVGDLQHDAFCQNFYEAVIDGLESDLEVLTNKEATGT
ncbi:hypothetical protein F5Y14DRAFT_444251 [Nemania sp. NC0429]|nr:hypothetical protein F5Y14DRAFT_444251 [Nemania sp. NC0429]